MTDAGVIRKVREDGLALAKDAAAKEAPATRRRGPLGLRPVPDQPTPARTAPAAQPVADDLPASLDTTLAEGLDMVAGVVDTFSEQIGKLHSEIEHLRTTIAELKAELSGVTAKGNETAFVVQRLQLDRTGPQGPPGPMGRDGRDGAQGPKGEKGNRGQRGFEIIGWDIDTNAYSATPQFYDGQEGPPLCLLGMFQKYNNDTMEAEALSETELETERAAEQRAAHLLEIERVRRGWPARG
jgi:hypothetical protein